MHPLLYLTFHSFKNRMRVRIQRLREPRYLLGLVFGFAYFYFIFFRSTARVGRASFFLSAGLADMPGSLELLAALILFVFLAISWIPQGSKSPLLTFTRAEVHFLFPAPFTRRQLIRYRILRSQFGSLFSSAFITLIFRPSSFARSWMFLLGISLLMSIVKLHLVGIMLNRQSMNEHGWLGLKRQWLAPVLFAGSALVLATAVSSDWARLSTLAGAGPVLTELRQLLSVGMPSIVLWPFLAVVRLPFSASPSTFLQTLPWTLGILLLNYFWVVRSDAAFEEASAEFAEKIAKRRKGMQPSRRASATSARASATPFSLAAKGPPETAILWKNLIMVGRYLSLKTLLVLAPLLFVFGIPFAKRGAAGLSNAIGGVSLLFAILLIFFGPMMARNDLRQDLGNLAMLKTWPIGGASLVRGEVLAPAVILTALAWLLAIVITIFSPAKAGISYPYIGAGILLAPGIILIQLLVQNAIAVMFPSWIRIGQNQPRGIDVMGQRMIMTFGMLIVLVFALLPAALIAAAAGYIGYAITKSVHIILPAAIAALVLLTESYFASEAIGHLLDRTDVSAIDAPEQ
jgi:hypothetical protein